MNNLSLIFNRVHRKDLKATHLEVDRSTAILSHPLVVRAMGDEEAVPHQVHEEGTNYLDFESQRRCYAVCDCSPATLLHTN